MLRLIKNKHGVSLTFKSEITTVGKNSDGKIVEGNPDEIKKQKIIGFQ